MIYYLPRLNQDSRFAGAVVGVGLGGFSVEAVRLLGRALNFSTATTPSLAEADAMTWVDVSNMVNYHFKQALKHIPLIAK